MAIKHPNSNPGRINEMVNKYFAITMCLLAFASKAKGSCDILDDLSSTRIDPVSSFQQAIIRYQNQIDYETVLDQSIHDLLHTIPEAARPAVCNRAEPQFQTVETDQGIVLVGVMPGLRKEDLSLSIHNGPQGQMLEVTGGSSNFTCPDESKPQAEKTQAEAPAFNVGYSKFERSIALSSGLDVSALHAKYYDGLLAVIIPKSTKSSHQIVPLQ
jgi:HSP20 family molecular chaperone IbpA